MSLDTSTKVSGYAIFNNKELIRYSSIDKSDKSDSYERMSAMVYEITAIIEREAPDVVVIEETVVTRNP